MRKILTLLFSIVVSLTALTAHAGGSLLNGGGLVADQDLLNFYERVKPLQRSLIDSAGSAQMRKSKTVSTRAPAPPLTYLEVYGIMSSNYDSTFQTYDYVPPSEYYPSFDHGGSNMYVITAELGYGSNPIARINGSSLTQIDSLAITDSGGTVIGWYRMWNASGYQSGQFTYQNTSINSPWNTMSDWVMIQ